MHPPVYLDHAATTPVRPEVLEAMMPYLTDQSFGNPSSAHRFGRAARAGMEQARRQIAEAVGAEPNQVVFTSGGTEADNLGIVGAALAARERGAEMCAVVSAIEHKAVLAAAHAVCHLGGREVLLPVDSGGRLDLDALDRTLAESPAVVSVMWVNNEVGVIQPVQEIAGRCRDAGIIFHTDAVQAFGKVPVSLRELSCTLVTLSGHKIGGPKGIGALIVRDRKAIEAIIHGGGQQFGIRPGTENVAGAVALGRAAQLAAAEQGAVAERVGALRNDLAARLKATVPDLVVNAETSERAPHLLSVAVPGADSEALLMHLDLAGIAVSSGSACSTGAVEPSHVLVAMGVSRELALGTIRFSFGRESTRADVDRAAEVVPAVAAKVRKLAGVLGRAVGAR
jgi:cysteine desulfurase